MRVYEMGAVGIVSETIRVPVAFALWTDEEPSEEFWKVGALLAKIYLTARLDYDDTDPDT